MQNTLWPEAQKLYGHGYEIYSLATRKDGIVLASSCKATTPEHAAIILWYLKILFLIMILSTSARVKKNLCFAYRNAKTWLQIQKLIAHQLTVTQMSFSPDGKQLLSVSRDRRWCLFGVKEDGKTYELLAASDVKNNLHSRVIWCCAWTIDSLRFATGSRDGKIGIWTPIKSDDGLNVTVTSVANLELSKECVTALAFAPILKNGFHILAIGLEKGIILLYRYLDSILENLNIIFQGNLGHDLAVKRLVFRPKVGRTGDKKSDSDKNVLQLASCGSDHIVKIFDLFLDPI